MIYSSNWTSWIVFHCLTRTFNSAPTPRLDWIHILAQKHITVTKETLKVLSDSESQVQLQIAAANNHVWSSSGVRRRILFLWFPCWTCCFWTTSIRGEWSDKLRWSILKSPFQANCRDRPLTSVSKLNITSLTSRSIHEHTKRVMWKTRWRCLLDE